mgnify:CR=1 FL=1
MLMAVARWRWSHAAWRESVPSRQSAGDGQEDDDFRPEEMSQMLVELP